MTEDVKERTEEEFADTEEKVRHALENSEKCRDNPRYLSWWIRKNVDNLDMPPWSEWKKFATNGATIRRKGRELSEEYPPSSEAEDAREEKEEAVREHYADQDGQSKLLVHDGQVVR